MAEHTILELSQEHQGLMLNIFGTNLKLYVQLF